MAQDYDKIFKENLEELIKSLARVVLKIDYTKMEEIPDESQYTIEKKPDFLKRVKGDKPEEDYIFQMEIQTTDPPTMIHRMLIYYGFLFHDYKIPIKQYVLYIGNKRKASMPTSLEHYNLKFKFHLINIVDIPHQDFLYSNRPEDVVIAILCDFKDQTPGTILETILIRLKLLVKNELTLGKYVRQLEVLSKLRNLQTLMIKKVEAMPLLYDLETDIRYLQGFEKGKKEAEAEKLALQKQAEAQKLVLQKQIEAQKLVLQKQAEAQKLALQKQAEAQKLVLQKQIEAQKIALQQQAEAKKLALAKQAEAELALAKQAEAERLALEKKKEAEKLALQKAEAEKRATQKITIKNLLKINLNKDFIAEITLSTLELVNEVESELKNELKSKDEA